MSVKTILVPVSDGEASEAALSTALSVGARLEAHVDVLHVRADPRDAVPFVGEGMSSAMIEDMVDLAAREAKDRALKARRLFEAHRSVAGAPLVEAAPAPPGLSVAWREEIGREDEVVARMGRLVDLIVVGHPGRSVELPSSLTLHAALMETGRPVLMASAKANETVGDSVALAWNGSTEAARAVAAAMPFLRAARKVSILVAEEGERVGPTAADLAATLAWHNVKVEIFGLHHSSRSGTVASILLTECARLGADLLVMGAYGHNRLREMILGGVTRDILETAKIPVLMTH